MKPGEVGAAMEGRALANAPHVPSEEKRTIVSLCKALAFTDAQTADMVGCSETTLKKYYREELAAGSQRIHVKIAGNVARMAMRQTNEKVTLTAAIFWLKGIVGVKDNGEGTAGGSGVPTFAQQINIGASGREQVYEFSLKIGDKKPIDGPGSLLPPIDQAPKVA
jgi:hypothetical protein